MYYLLFTKLDTGIVLNPDAQTRNLNGIYADPYVPVATRMEADSRAQEVFRQISTVEISLFNEEKQCLQRLLP